MAKAKAQNPEWSVVYCRAIQSDGSLFFPERLTKEFLERTRRVLGSYIFANQYQNEIIPLEDQTFKDQWKRYYATLPDIVGTYAFIDPAISEEETADYTATVVVSVDRDQKSYVRYASRERINPSRVIDKCFEIARIFKPIAIGIESVAFQKSLIHFAAEEMRRRGNFIPVCEVPRNTDQTKHMRIMSLVPRFEFGSLYLAQGLYDLELELGQYPRGAHVDLLDALSSVYQLVAYPTERRTKDEQAPAPNHPHYEQWFIKNKLAKRNGAESGDE